MVSPLTLKLIGSSCASNSSGETGSGSSRAQKRKMMHDSSESGYSADREGSASSSPLNTIEVVDGSSKKKESMREMNNCPKRHKRSELQFAASSVKADLARAGIEFSAVDPQCESTSKFGDVSISLKGVKLMGSKEFGKNPLVNSSAPPGSVQEYQALALACFGLYPRSLAKPAKISTMSQDSDGSTSSVSESDTESVTSKTNLQSDPGAPYVIPPLSKETPYTTMSAAPHNPSDSCGLLSMSRNALSLSETMALTNTPRLVAMSQSPFPIVHANAAFFRLSGLPSEKIIGSGFASIIKNPRDVTDASSESSCNEHILLTDCMAFSDAGNHQKLQIIQNIGDDATEAPVERYFKVLPVVSSKPTNGKKVSSVTHLAVDLLGESEGAMLNIRDDSQHDPDMAVGVMG